LFFSGLTKTRGAPRVFLLGASGDAPPSSFASEAQQSIAPREERMDCFAEPVITARAQLRSSSGAHLRDPLARNDGSESAAYATIST
jgi:hypothetical protein